MLSQPFEPPRKEVSEDPGRYIGLLDAQLGMSYSLQLFSYSSVCTVNPSHTLVHSSSSSYPRILKVKQSKFPNYSLIMRSLFFAGLASLALAAPRPQNIDTEAVEAAPDPVMVTPAVATPSQRASIAAAVVEAAAATKVSLLKRTNMICGGEEDPSACIEVESKRDVQVRKRDGDCSKQPLGSGPVPSPDTAVAFSSNQDIQDLARSAPTPDGYSLVFSNLDGSLSTSVYMGLTTMDSYDTLGCQNLCDRAVGCVAFNGK